ncbi:hypothetical protein AGLY_003460 [Aphis glycines]|uniref:Uncharacterized protein n=1 Tax=Aphis glycines TaxID=307491 RepID=A0A6G0U071_APHGL|nr:hypothetical protein AGLY_003460 [Aphis glycines]
MTGINDPLSDNPPLSSSRYGSIEYIHIGTSESSDQLISCKYEYCDILLCKPESIDDLYCSLACKNLDLKKISKEENVIDKTTKLSKTSKVDQKYLISKLENKPTSFPEAMDDDDYSDLKTLIEDKDVLKYMVEMQSKSAPKKLFDKPFSTEKNLFVVGQKLEGIDTQHEALFCEMTVSELLIDYTSLLTQLQLFSMSQFHMGNLLIQHDYILIYSMNFHNIYTQEYRISILNQVVQLDG